MEKSTIKREQFLERNLERLEKDSIKEELIKELKNTCEYEVARVGDASIDFKSVVKEVLIDNINKIKNFFRRKNK